MNEQMPQNPLPPLTPEEERQWAMIAHLGVLVNLVSGFLGPAVPLGIYMIYKDRSRYVAYQSLQALIFQLIGWVGDGILAGIAWAITGALSAVIVGLVCIPLKLSKKVGDFNNQFHAAGFYTQRNPWQNTNPAMNIK